MSDSEANLARRLVAVQELHEERHRTVKGYTLRWCRECWQDWPCPTVQAATTDPTDERTR